MNERIKELYSDAALYAFNQRFIPGVVRELQEVITEKFAELIVRECMAQIEEGKRKVDVYRTDVYDIGYDDGLTQAVETIKEHFGVEE